jgi:hypothetical protein
MKLRDDLNDGIFLRTARKPFASRATHGVCTMNGTAPRFLRLAVGLSGLTVLGWVLIGQAAQPAQEGLPTDWTHRHVIFSQPSTFEKVRQITSDPRYWQQWYRQNVARVLSDPAASDDAAMNLGSLADNDQVHRDWAEDLGPSAFVGAGNYPAKYSFKITSANCVSTGMPDYVVFSTGLLGASTQASVVAYDNLYSGCSGTSPTAYWAYNTGGQILTSPVISGDGSQVAFVQTNAGLEGTLVLLKWAAASGTVFSPVHLTAVANSAYRTCAAPCMTTIILEDSLLTPADDRTSSVFPDYTHDILWVGGATGLLYKITGAFRGTPAEAFTGGFPVQVSTGAALSSPVYDQTSTNVFVGDYSGIFHWVSTTGATPGTVTSSAQVDHGTGLVAGPIVDSTAEKVYVFSSSDGSTSCPAAAPTLPCSAVFQFAPNFVANSTGTKKITVGTSQVAPPNPNPLYAGGFDSTYEASANATGNLYVCGNTAGIPTLYQIPISAGTMGTALTGPTLAGATTGCSPVTDIPNPNATGGSAEWIFASTQASGSGNNCSSGGCIMNFNVLPWQPATAYIKGQAILDLNLNVQVVRVAGTSGAAHPGWSGTPGGATADGTGTLKWTCQGPHLASHPTWLASNPYAAGAEILDSNGNVEWTKKGGTSQTGTHPTWNTTIAGATTDGTVTWKMVGPIATASQAAAGGTSGIIIDNTVGSGTLGGASQVYYSTQGTQTCTGGSGGCAVQASQSALQ